MSNTKLSSYSKSNLKVMKNYFELDDGQIFSFDGFTVVIRPAFPYSAMALVSTSCASYSEQKHRRKVGEYFALQKMHNGEFMQVPISPCNFEAFAEDLAGFLGFSYS